MHARTLVLFLTSFLLSCASTSSSVREDATAAAPASASGGGGSSAPVSARAEPALRVASRINVSAPANWRVSSSSDGLHLFHGSPHPGIVRMALEPASSSPGARARREADALAARGAAIGPIEEGENYASFSWKGDLGSGQRNGIVAVRRPSGRQGSLIVMSGYWPPSAHAALHDEIGLVFLMASAE